MYFYIAFILALALDSITKLLAQSYLTDTKNILWDFVFLKYAENTGIAFSIQIPTQLLKILTIVLIIGIFYYYKQERKLYSSTKLIDISFGLILGWAIGNAYERVIHEKVIDFFGIQYFAIFNIADVAISMWAILYMVLLYKNKK